MLTQNYNKLLLDLDIFIRYAAYIGKCTITPYNTQILIEIGEDCHADILFNRESKDINIGFEIHEHDSLRIFYSTVFSETVNKPSYYNAIGGSWTIFRCNIQFKDSKMSSPIFELLKDYTSRGDLHKIGLTPIIADEYSYLNFAKFYVPCKSHPDYYWQYFYPEKPDYDGVTYESIEKCFLSTAMHKSILNLMR